MWRMEEWWKSFVIKIKLALPYKQKRVVRVHVKWKVRGGYSKCAWSMRA